MKKYIEILMRHPTWVMRLMGLYLKYRRQISFVANNFVLLIIMFISIVSFAFLIYPTYSSPQGYSCQCKHVGGPGNITSTPGNLSCNWSANPQEDLEDLYTIPKAVNWSM